jgi:acyl carrier protein phosphodiesterase
MNYLAHLYLAGNDAEALIGSLMGDFIKGRVDPDLPPVLRQAILQHRRIDSFTDAHPIVRRSKQRVTNEFRRYAGILIDVFYDHFLAREWSQYSDVSLEAFTDRVYELVGRHRETLPPRMQRSMHYMVRYDLLKSYRSVDGIAQALRGIETRLRRPSRLGDAVVELENTGVGFQRDFSEFFPQLIEFVENDNAVALLSAPKR